MLLQVGHQVDESDIYNILTTRGDTASMFRTTILQPIFKPMVKEKVLILAQGFCPTYHILVTQALVTFLGLFWDSIHIFVEYMQ